MSKFPSVNHASSWAGLSPGNNESAGKRKSGRTRKGNNALKVILVQAAKSAVKVKESFYRAQYERIMIRRGKNRATVAVAHTMLMAIYYIIKDNMGFKELGVDFYNKFNKKKKARSYIKRLEQLGYAVDIKI